LKTRKPSRERLQALSNWGFEQLKITPCKIEFITRQGADRWIRKLIREKTESVTRTQFLLLEMDDDPLFTGLLVAGQLSQPTTLPFRTNKHRLRRGECPR
jgi:hypothetical protein